MQKREAEELITNLESELLEETEKLATLQEEKKKQKNLLKS